MELSRHAKSDESARLNVQLIVARFLSWPRWVRDELAHLLPELGPAPQRLDSEAARARLFDACAEAWLLLAAGNFDSVIFDDWHLADAPSRALVDHIVRGRAARQRDGAAPEGPREILLLRPGTLPADGEPSDALTRDGLALHLRLQPLAPAAVEALAARLSGTPLPPRWAAGLLQASGGFPFAIGETLRQWAALSLWPTGAGGPRAPNDTDTGQPPSVADDAMPEAVRQAVLGRVASLPEAARRVLEAAALATEPFTPALLAGACALSEVQALDAIDAAMAAHLLRERDGGFAFTHDLVQAALEGALGADRKRLVHRRLALGAEALHGVTAVPPAEIARHWEQGGEPQRAVEPRLAAAAAALALFSEELAEQHWTMALADGAGLAQQVRVAAQRGSMARNRDDRESVLAAIAELERLRDACAQHPDTASCGLDAAIEAADLLSLMRDCAGALVRIDAVLAALPVRAAAEPAGAARRGIALLVKSQALNGLGRSAEGAATAEEALALGGLGPQQKGRLLHSIVFAHFLDNRIDQALAGAERSLSLWRSVGNRRSMARAHGNIGLMQTQLGRNDEGRREMGRAIALADEMRMFELKREVLLNVAYLDLQDGQPQAALDRLAAAWNAAPTFSSNSAPVFIRGMQVHGHAHLGELGTALDRAEDGHRRAVELGAPDSLADCVSMCLDLATDLGEFALADRWVASLPDDASMSSQYRTKLSFNLVHLALARDDLDTAAAALQALGDVATLAQPVDRGYAALRHAELCLARGDAAGALAWLDRGRADATPIEARAAMQAVRVRALRRLRGAGDAASVQARTQALALLAGVAKVPALAALELSHACDANLRDPVLRLADSLESRPALRAKFIARWLGAGMQ